MDKKSKIIQLLMAIIAVILLVVVIISYRYIYNKENAKKFMQKSLKNLLKKIRHLYLK